MINQLFGKLLIVSRSDEKTLNRTIKWNCLCLCGNSCTVIGASLRSGHTKSCGSCPNDSYIDNFGACQVFIYNKKQQPYNSFVIDPGDRQLIKPYKWSLIGNGYIISKEKGLLHRFLINPPAGKIIDHINHDKLDNRRSNLRICTYSENLMNRKAFSSCGIKNVYYNVKRESYEVYILKNGRNKFGGSFKRKEDASRKANELMLQLHGEFANLNL